MADQKVLQYEEWSDPFVMLERDRGTVLTFAIVTVTGVEYASQARKAAEEWLFDQQPSFAGPHYNTHTVTSEDSRDKNRRDVAVAMRWSYRPQGADARPDPPAQTEVWVTASGNCWHESKHCAGTAPNRKGLPLADVAGAWKACPTCVSDMLADYAENLTDD